MNFETHTPSLDNSEPASLPYFSGTAPSEPVVLDVGVADYFDRHPEEAVSILVARAPDVLVLSRCIGAPKTAGYFADRLKCKVTEKMIKTIKTKVRKEIILVTREELEAAARSHPTTAARMAREPSLCDPQHYRTSIQPAEENETETDDGKQAAAKKAAARSKKTAEAKNPGTPDEPKTPTALESPTKPEPPTAPESPTGLKQIMSNDALAKKQELLAQLKKEVRGSQ